MTSTASSVNLGSATQDSATLTGGATPSGSLVFELFGPADSTCSKAPAFTSAPVKVAGDGSYQGPSFVPKAVGTYSWVDLYSGDAKNGAATTACSDPAETVSVVGPPTLTVTHAGSGSGL